jgi:hypothetical protein
MMLASNLLLTFLALISFSIRPIEGIKTKERKRNDNQQKEDLESENKAGRNGKSNQNSLPVSKFIILFFNVEIKLSF